MFAITDFVLSQLIDGRTDRQTKESIPKNNQK